MSTISRQEYIDNNLTKFRGYNYDIDILVDGNKEHLDYYGMVNKGYVVGYKAFWYNRSTGSLRCLDKEYIPGTEYKLADELDEYGDPYEIEMCAHGYHFCLSPFDTYKYYGQHVSSDEDRPVILAVVATGNIR